jgi:hypothetical protein
MITRSFDPEDLRTGTDLYRDMVPGDFDFESWVKNPDNLLLKDEDSIGFITYEYPGVYSPHHFHKSRRGKEAMDCSREMLKYAFDNHPVEVLRGLTPAHNKPARWIARQMGCISYGVLDTARGPEELLILTRERFYEVYRRSQDRLAHNRRTKK